MMLQRYSGSYPRSVSVTLAILFWMASQAAVCTALTSGIWTAPSTWDCDRAPIAGDVLIIPAGITVSVNSNTSYSGPAMRVRIYGTLSFIGGGSKLAFPCGSIVEIMTSTATIIGDGTGNSETIRICGSGVWSVGTDNGATGYAPYPAGSTLPVGLLYFTGVAEGSGIRCTWMTASETNSDRFELLRSRDPEHMEVVAVLAAAGNSQQTTRYEHVDMPEGSGVWYYHLVQYDQDGLPYDLGTIAVTSEAVAQIHCYPVPASDHIDVVLPEAPAEVYVMGMDGRVFLKQPAVTERVRIDASTLHDGVYMIRVEGIAKSSAQPVLVVH
jgi:hypothetical protein